MERFIRQVFIPWLYIMDEMNARRLPTRTLRDILDDDETHEYSKFDHIEWRNAKVTYQVLAGAHLGARKQMAEFMPFIEQMVSTPPIMQAISDAGLKFDANVYVKFWGQLAGIRYNMPFFVPMSDQEKQQKQMQSPAGIQQMKNQAQAQLQDKNNAAKTQQIADQSLGRAAEKTMQLLAEHTMQGEVGDQGTIGEENFGG